MATALATTIVSVQFDFQNNNVEAMTLNTFWCTHKENDIYGNPFKGTYHYKVIEHVADVYQEHDLNYEVEEVFVIQNKNKARPGVVALSQVEQKYGAMTVEAYILCCTYTTVCIKERETDGSTAALIATFHQDGIRAIIGPCVRVCHNQCTLSPERSVLNYGKDRVTTKELLGCVDEWLSNFEVQVNEDGKCIHRLKTKVITPVEMHAYIGLLMALRVSHDSSDKCLSSKVGTYPLNQPQIFVFTEGLLKLTEEKKTLMMQGIYNVTAEIYKSGCTDAPAMVSQDGVLAELIFPEGLLES